MNYLAAMILIGVEMNEPLAYTILVKLMDEEGYKLSGLYEKEMRKLFEISEYLEQWIHAEEPEIELILSSQGLQLGTIFAGPLFTLFANIADLQISLRVLDRVIHNRSYALKQIIKNVISNMKYKIIKST